MDAPKPLEKQLLPGLLSKFADGTATPAEKGAVLDGFLHGTLGIDEAIQIIDHAAALRTEEVFRSLSGSHRLMSLIEPFAFRTKHSRLVEAYLRVAPTTTTAMRGWIGFQLARIETREASEAMCAILELSPEIARDANIWHFVSIPRDPDTFFPRLLPLLLHRDSAERVVDLLLAFAAHGMLKKRHVPSAAVAAVMPALDAHLRSLFALCRKCAKPPGLRWCYKGKYSFVRHRLTMLIDVMGLLSPCIAEPMLREALKLPDPRAVCFAAIRLRSLDCDVGKSVWAKLARSPRERALLYQSLSPRDFDRLIPSKWRTAQAVSEGLLVDWLTFGTELGFEPAKIAPMRPVEVVEDRKRVTYFLFKYKPTPKAEWLVGLGGAFTKGMRPVIKNNVSVTFSGFDKLGERTAAQHLADYRSAE